MFEKRWATVVSQAFTSNGTSDGHLTVSDPSLFKVKQRVILSSTTQPDLVLEVKRIVAPNSIYVGKLDEPIYYRTDISGFLLADSANIRANEQNRSSIPQQEVERLTYEEEPVVARRVILVDELGNLIDGDNPLPVDATVNVGEITIESDAKDGDNIAVSAHPDPIFHEAADTIITDTWEEIYSYTSVNDLTRIVGLHIAISTPSTLRVKIDALVIREHRTSPTERNADIIFVEHRPLTIGKVIKVEAKVDRKIWPTYTTFTSLEGYLA